VRACAATHEGDIPRLYREGLRFDKYLVPTSCRACMDPLCMIRCPVGAIRRKESLTIVIEPWCIGCNACAEECPYGNINVVELANRGVPVRKAMTGGPKAVVCDLCADYEEPNCVRACPHDAAIRVPPSQFFARQLRGEQLASLQTVEIKTAQELEQEGKLTGVADLGELQAAAQSAAQAMALSDSTGSAASIPEASPVANLIAFLPRLKVMSGPRAGDVLQLKAGITKFGRHPDNDYVFPQDTSLSRFQCVIRSEGRRFFVADASSLNGTFLNGNPLSTVEAEVRSGDVIQMGDNELQFLYGALQ
jgi:Fe-S-cluster-containing hydrogenase component 2